MRLHKIHRLAFFLSSALVLLLIGLPSLGVAILFSVQSDLEGFYTITNSYSSVWILVVCFIYCVLVLLDAFSDVLLKLCLDRRNKQKQFPSLTCFLILRCLLSSLMIVIGFIAFITYACVAEVEYVAGICSLGLIALGFLSLVMNIFKYKWVKLRGTSETFHYDKLLRPRSSREEDEDDGFLKYRADSGYYDEELKDHTNLGLMRRRSQSSVYKYKEHLKVTKYCVGNMICKIIFYALLLLPFGLSLAFLYQSVGYAIDEVMPVGKLVTITNSKDGSSYRIHIDCKGTPINNYPTIVVDSGLGISSSSVYWSDIQNAISQYTKICVYDRAGYSFSDSGYSPRTSQQIVNELDSLLTAHNISEKLLLIGHSFGGMNVRLYASIFPEKVAGLLLIDPSHENQTIAFRLAQDKSIDPQAIANDLAKENLYLNTGRIMAPLGSLRLTAAIIPDQVLNPFSKGNLSSNDWKILRFSALSNKYSNVIYSESAHFSTTSAQQVLAHKKSFGNLPLMILTAGASINGTCAQNHFPDDSQECKDHLKYMKSTAHVIEELEQDVLKLSTQSEWKIIWNASHNIAIDNPEAVIENIKEMLDKSKAQ
ncbi:hypothetical protein C9374_006333 [Naegleria lovaniensis]|uniref:AB hydrolase-1 domain-containing protein n=1 Tax=Naegleria lovaniensis TaxID=51637 RepID=A0AA88GI01_NAELO|nr:uncharacterized protein C9374_006333 [Naegleria lovaniensis]KAG2381344.1 hypothetical protein C9374_006333 [Naegleria lovaniensis]